MFTTYPKSLKIGKYIYRFIYSRDGCVNRLEKELPDFEAHVGECDYYGKYILISLGNEKEYFWREVREVWATIWHEVFHAVCFENEVLKELTYDEEKIEQFGQMFYLIQEENYGD